MLDFRPPLDSPFLIKTVKLCLPAFMKFALHDTVVTPVEGAVERFKQHKGKRALVCPNHANRHDPMTMFSFSRTAGEDFNFIAAREVFDWDHGFNGWLLQHLGVYSVVRGAADRESFKTTKRLLCEGKKKLVLFPEGEISRQNDTLMPLESGAAQMTFWALDELAKHGDHDAQMVIVPMALKYTYVVDIKRSLGHTIGQLEERLSLTNKEDESKLYERLRKVSETLLETLEKEYGFKAKPDSTLNDRVNSLRGFILENVARQLNVPISSNGRQLESVRVLRNAMDDFIYMDEHEASDYQKKVHTEKSVMLKGLYSDLDRVVNFIAIYDGYLKENLTQERFSDILDRLEREVMRTREPSFRGPRRVLIDVGEAIDVRQLYSNYKSEKKATIAKVTEHLGSEIARLLVGLDQYRQPLLIG